MNNLAITLRKPPAPAPARPEIDLNSLPTIEEGSEFDYLPDDMVRQILIRVPARDIFYATMFVCWKWCKIIRTHDFKYAHLRHSAPGLLIKNLHVRGSTYMTMRQDGKIDISEYSYNFKHMFWCSCNGLMLEATFGDSQKLTITNPVTKQHFNLPPFFARVPSDSPYGQSAIAYAATLMKYKVIRLDFVDANNLQLGKYCSILTVGADSSWRLVDTQHLSLMAKTYFYCTPFVTQGFVHWVRRNSSSFLTLNVETEIFTQIFGPPEGTLHYHFSAGSCVSVLIALSYFKWEVWEMRPETGEWTKMFGIDLEDQKNRLCSEPGECVLNWQLRPAGWLKYLEVMIFIVFKPNNKLVPTQTRLRVAYNVRTKAMHLFTLEPNYSPYLVHSNSLLWLDGC